ncbi:MAG: chemotaxis protein CheB, partial [Verrucomicrobiales bacterium]|nr:chemotaxis protein CheB [Verrucomicrobiales bacterium]
MKKPSPTRRSPDVVPVCATRRETGASQFPIVGVGASAGGLEALEEFLGHVPEGSGWAFIIVQHLDPTRRGMLPELLRRSTVMKVVQVKDRTRVQPDRVYVIPPNKDLSFRRGVLHLLEPTAPRGQRLPIDFLFRSLARDLHAQSIGVILSGMGSDGTLGARAIKEQAGLIVVQEPGTARFDSMPRSVVSAGLADGVAPVKEIPARILSHLKHLPVVSQVSAEPPEALVRNAFDQLIVLLRARTGQDFSHYKRNTLHRRMERRMGIHALRRPAAYLCYLKENPQEVDLLFKELLIGVTRFFRDTEAWEQLATQVLPGMLAGRVPGRSLRAWVPGCSTGEEAYSLAIAFREATEARGAPGEVALQIFATDLDPDAIEKARQGLFAESLAADVSAARLARFFTREERGYRVQKSIREMVIFAPQNLVMDPPFTKLDLLCCRNLLIYLTPEVQAKLIPLFHYSLAPGGILFLGIAETIGKFTGLFTSLAGKS